MLGVRSGGCGSRAVGMHKVGDGLTRHALHALI